MARKIASWSYKNGIHSMQWCIATEG